LTDWTHLRNPLRSQNLQRYVRELFDQTHSSGVLAASCNHSITWRVARRSRIHRYLDVNCLQRADIIAVDSLSDNETNGEIARHIDALPPPHRIIEIGHVLGGRHPGRTDQAHITIAKFVGLGVQDLAAATESLRRVRLSEIDGAA
jgi:Ornithine cyclodeaminase/mu-crystallin family